MSIKKKRIKNGKRVKKGRVTNAVEKAKRSEIKQARDALYSRRREETQEYDARVLNQIINAGK
jgi:hypothetical protein